MRGKLAYRVMFKEGIPNGQYTTYDEDGKLKSSGLVKDGYEEGLHVNYSFDGEVRDRWFYIRGKVIWSEYSYDGFKRHYD